MSIILQTSKVREACRRFLILPTSLTMLGLTGLVSVPESLQAGVAVRGPRGGGAAVNVGRAGRPVAAAPVARGTARRTTRRTMRRLTVLPAGYRTAVVAGTTYYVVNSVYYKPYYEGSQVVYVEVEVNQ